MSEFDELAKIVANLDARDAQISKVEDREYILGQVAALDGGLGAVTARVCEAMNGWLVAQGEAELARLPAAERGTSVLINQRGTAAEGSGRPRGGRAAVPRGAAGVPRNARGSAPEDTLTSINNLALLLKAQGDLAARRSRCSARRCRRGARRSAIGTPTPSPRSTTSRAAAGQGDLAAAEPLMREALQARRETLGDRHPEHPHLDQQPRHAAAGQGDLAAAEPLYREALQARRETLGDRHPDTLTSINNLASLLQAKGDLAAAEPLCREALQARRETLGDRHPSCTLTSINNLGNAAAGPGRPRGGGAAVPRGAAGAARDARRPPPGHPHLDQQPRHAAAGPGRPRRGGAADARGAGRDAWARARRADADGAHEG